MSKESENKSSDEENFEDARDDIEVNENFDLIEAIDHSGVSLDMFLNNRFEESKQRMESRSKSSFYHALGYATVMNVQAIMTMVIEDIKTAGAVARKSVDVCHHYRRRLGLASSLMKSTQTRKNFYSEFTDEQCHAELCYAETLLGRAGLMFLDENLMNLVKGGLKIRECYKSYRECWKILQHRKWSNENLKLQFECGTRMGIGAFNLMLSLMPPKILKLLEFIGFSGNKNFGMQQLQLAAAMPSVIRTPLCSLILLLYQAFLAQIFGLGGWNAENCRVLLKPCLEKYPRGALFLFFNGRINLLNGDIDTAIGHYESSISSQSEWSQFHHICYWELMWCYSFKSDWLFAMKYAETLSNESRWSKATYLYLKGCFMFMLEEQTPETRKHLRDIFEQVPNLLQKFVGKSISIEKFALRKSKRFLGQNGRLTLPALEAAYLWNLFMIIGRNAALLDNALRSISSAKQYVLDHKDIYTNYLDDYCLCLLLHGVALKYLKEGSVADITSASMKCFDEVLSNEKNIKIDLYLLPWCEYEIALLAFENEDYDNAKKHLNLAREYKGYALESILHFRMHGLANRLKAVQDNEERGTTEEDGMNEEFEEFSSSQVGASHDYSDSTQM